MGERPGCLKPFWAATNGWHDHSACATRGFAGSVALSANFARWAALLAGSLRNEDVLEADQHVNELVQDAVWCKLLLTMPKRLERCGAMAGFAIMIRWLVNGEQQDAMHLAPVFCGVVTGD